MSFAAGDALEDEFQLSEEDEDEGSGSDGMDEGPVSKLDARRKARAAGDDELHMQFKAESAALLEKYGIKAPEAGDWRMLHCACSMSNANNPFATCIFTELLTGEEVAGSEAL